MPKPKGKGEKRRRQGKGDGEETKRALEFKDDGQEQVVTVKINVVTIEGSFTKEGIILHMKPSMTVLEAKLHVQNNNAIPPEERHTVLLPKSGQPHDDFARMFFKGFELEDNKTLKECGVKDGSTIRFATSSTLCNSIRTFVTSYKKQHPNDAILDHVKNEILKPEKFSDFDDKNEVATQLSKKQKQSEADNSLEVETASSENQEKLSGSPQSLNEEASDGENNLTDDRILSYIFYLYMWTCLWHLRDEGDIEKQKSRIISSNIIIDEIHQNLVPPNGSYYFGVCCAGELKYIDECNQGDFYYPVLGFDPMHNKCTKKTFHGIPLISNGRTKFRTKQVRSTSHFNMSVVSAV